MTVWTKLLVAASGSLLVCCTATAQEPDVFPVATGPQRSAPGAELPAAPPSPLPSGFSLPDADGTPAASSQGIAAAGNGRVIWATAGTKLLKLASNAPSTVDVRNVAGLAQGEQLVGVDFRKNGQLYAVGSTSRLFAVATASATATAVSFAPFAARLDGTAFGFGFDPVSDLARVTSNTAENIRIEADTGTVTNVDGALRYAPGDTNAGIVPRVSGVAYAADGAGYAIDAKIGSLARIVDSYSGELTTIGALGIAGAEVAGFDIAGADALAALRIGTMTSLYAVDLSTGKVAKVGSIGDGSPVTGLAIEP